MCAPLARVGAQRTRPGECSASRGPGSEERNDPPPSRSGRLTRLHHEQGAHCAEEGCREQRDHRGWGLCGRVGGHGRGATTGRGRGGCGGDPPHARQPRSLAGHPAAATRGASLGADAGRCGPCSIPSRSSSSRRGSRPSMSRPAPCAHGGRTAPRSRGATIASCWPPAAVCIGRRCPGSTPTRSAWDTYDESTGARASSPDAAGLATRPRALRRRRRRWRLHRWSRSPPRWSVAWPRSPMVTGDPTVTLGRARRTSSVPISAPVRARSSRRRSTRSASSGGWA